MAKLPRTYTLLVKFERDLGEDLAAIGPLDGKLAPSQALVRQLVKELQQFAFDDGAMAGTFQVVGPIVLGGEITHAERTENRDLIPELDGEREFILVGDVKHPARVKVRARTRAEAVELAEQGNFTVYDESQKTLAFDWNGDDASVEES